MKSTTSREMVQRGHNFAIVDEVDSILIDEARTPLIISGPSRGPLRALQDDRHADDRADQGPEHYDLDEKQRQAIADRGGLRDDRGDRLRETDLLGRRRRRSTTPDQPRPPRQPGAARQRPVPAGQGLHRPGRRGDADRRVHRPDDDTAGGCRRACTRRSRPRKASTSSRRTRPSRRSPSRTTSASTRSSRA